MLHRVVSFCEIMRNIFKEAVIANVFDRLNRPASVQAEPPGEGVT